MSAEQVPLGCSFETPIDRLAALTAIESGWLADRARTHKGDRSLWIGVAPPPADSAGWEPRTCFIVGSDCGFTGDVRGSLDALPVVEATISQVVVQHAHELVEDGDSLLAQCAELLRPAGELVVFGFHPWSMWQRRIPLQGPLNVRSPRHWQQSLRSLGLPIQKLERIGPAWPGAPGLFDRFGMAFALRAARTGAVIIPLSGRLAAKHPRTEFALATRTSASLRQTA